ncbi:MAG TPA: hypothetical protein VF611_04980, partial [Pyrinomonadaceae bacterium]
MSAPKQSSFERRVVGSNVWLSREGATAEALTTRALRYEVLPTEEAVGLAQWGEVERAAREKTGDLVIILLGGRGAQAMYRHVAEMARTAEADELLGRLHVFTQDALAPMRMDNGLSFVRDFERLLGEAFFRKVKSFTPMRTDTEDLEGGLAEYLSKLEALGGIDIFFLGLGPEAGAAAHLADIKPGSGAA